MVSGSLWAYLQLIDPHNFPVNKVTVTGQYDKVSQQAIKARVLPYAMQGFFGFNVTAIQEDLSEVPWVYQTSIHREWPDQLVIEIEQQKATAIWNDKLLFNDNKELFMGDFKGLENKLPHLYGPKNLYKEVQAGYESMNQILSKLNLSITEISMDQRHSWRVRLNNEIYLIIGHLNVKQILTNFVQVYPTIIADRANEVNYIDLRYHNGMAVHWKKDATFV